MSLISAWTLFVAVLLAQEIVTAERLGVEDALRHLAGIIQHLKSLGLSNERIKTAVEDNLHRQHHRESFGYGGDRNWPAASPQAATRHQAEERQQIFQNVVNAGRFHWTPDSFVPPRTPVYRPSGRPQPAVPILGPGGMRHQINQRGPMNSDETRLVSRLLRVFLNSPKAQINRRKYKNGDGQEKLYGRPTASRTRPESADDNALSENAHNGEPIADPDVVSMTEQGAPGERPKQRLDDEMYGLDLISKNMESPLPPIKGVALEISLPDDVMHRQTVALSPGLSVYRALYQAALHYDGDDVTTNPFEVSIEPDVQRKCYVISGVSGYDDGDTGHWLITVMDATGEVKYEGRCLMPNSKLPLRPGYTIHLQYEHDK